MSIQQYSYIMLTPNRVWRTYLGGKTLDMIDGKSECRDTHMAEDWIASTTLAANPGRESLKHEGLSSISLCNCETLSDFIKLGPERILGKKHVEVFGNTMGVLTKLLDSGLRLHLQCHPRRSFSQQHLGVNAGKTECYIILSIRETVANPYVYLGFQHAPSESVFKRVVEAQDIERLLSWFEPLSVAPGDILMVPGGMPHAIGEGILMIEVMEPTDLTVRFEFEREGIVLPESARYMGRDINFATSMVDFRSYSPTDIKEHFFVRNLPIVTNDKFSLVSCVDRKQTDCFKIQQLKVRLGETCLLSSESFYIGVVTHGNGAISAEEQTDFIKPFSRFVVPRYTDRLEIHAETDLTIVLIYPPDSGENEIVTK